MGSVFLQWIFDPYLKPKMDTDKELFENFTAETQSTLRQAVLPNRETAIGQKTRPSETICFCLSSSSDKQKSNSLRSQRLCGEIAGFLSALIGVSLRLICEFGW